MYTIKFKGLENKIFEIIIFFSYMYVKLIINLAEGLISGFNIIACNVCSAALEYLNQWILMIFSLSSICFFLHSFYVLLVFYTVQWNCQSHSNMNWILRDETFRKNIDNELSITWDFILNTMLSRICIYNFWFSRTIVILI